MAPKDHASLGKKRTVLGKTKSEVRVTPFASAPILATLKQKTKLRTSWEYAGYFRAELPNGSFGWIKKTDVSPSSSKATKGFAKHLQWNSFQPPQITLTTKNAVFTSPTGKFINVGASIFDDEGVKDVFIFVNQKKVFYQSFSRSGSAPEKTAHFKAMVPLDSGMNRVILVARDSLDLSKRESFVIHRLASSKNGDATVSEDQQGGMMDDLLMGAPGH